MTRARTPSPRRTWARSMVDAGRSFAGLLRGAAGGRLPGLASRAPTSASTRPGSTSPRCRGRRTCRSRPSRASYAALPDLSFVIPDLDHDMHDGTVGEGDQWLRSHLGGYATWAATHNSLLVLTWDEDDRSESNRVVTVIAGAHVRPGPLRRARRPLPPAEHAGGARARSRAWAGASPLPRSPRSGPPDARARQAPPPDGPLTGTGSRRSVVASSVAPRGPAMRRIVVLVTAGCLGLGTLGAAGSAGAVSATGARGTSQAAATAPAAATSASGRPHGGLDHLGPVPGSRPGAGRRRVRLARGAAGPQQAAGRQDHARPVAGAAHLTRVDVPGGDAGQPRRPRRLRAQPGPHRCGRAPARRRHL